MDLALPAKTTCSRSQTRPSAQMTRAGTPRSSMPTQFSTVTQLPQQPQKPPLARKRKRPGSPRLMHSASAPSSSAQRIFSQALGGQTMARETVAMVATRRRTAKVLEFILECLGFG
ncbi:hypothetical protein TYRP_012919 [Tyrophagus putrescentiae]|nr:hypothetical protein TYRP_012919 [Tyrophagus putrescentiae]